MKQDFATEDLKAELERSLGFRLRSLKRIGGGCAVNFRAVRDGDGFAFSVKCSPFERQELFGHLVRHLADMKGSKSVQRVFEKECPPVFRGYNVLCLAWCDGERRFPDRLSDEELRAFLDDYLAFSSAMQKTAEIFPSLPLGSMRKTALGNCRGLGGRIVRRLIDELIPEEDAAYAADRMRVIHGDLHPGNFLFADGRVVGFLDLEELRTGYPAEDLVRYFTFAAERLRWRPLRSRRTLRQFALAVRHLPYPADEWRVALVRSLLWKIWPHVSAKPPGVFRALNLAFRARLYRNLRQIVSREMGPVPN